MAALKGSQTEKNILTAFAGERRGYNEMDPCFAKAARDEGFEAEAMVMESVAVAEAQHEKRCVELAGNIKADRVVKRDRTAKWRGLNCGYIDEVLEAPEMCPACAHPQV